MKALRLHVALLAAAVFAASGQCVIACSTELCRDSAPPCHRHHHPSSQNSKQATCTHPLFVSEVARQPLVNQASGTAVRLNSVAAPVRALWPMVLGATDLDEQGTSPPRVPLLDITGVLRI